MRIRKPKRDPAKLECHKCKAPICFVPSGQDYDAKKHGPLNPGGVWLDIDGHKTASGYTIDGMELTGEILEEGADHEARGGRVFKVWLLHRCAAPGTPTNPDGSYGATDEAVDVRARQYKD